jgi:sulfonate transport system substrate-binding protein
MFSRRLALQLGAVCAAMALVTTTSAPRAAAADTVTIDWAYYNPVSLVLKQQGWLEDELKKDDIRVQWVQSLGSNKALEFLNAGSLDFGSTAGAAALLAKVNGNPIQTVWVYSKPEWTALVTRPDTGIAKVEDLKGKRVAVTKGTDPYIFLLRAMGQHGLTANDVNLVLLQHDQGRAALERGDVDAWAGLDPMMADVELSKGYPLFFRNPDANSYGVLNVREAFAAEHPEVVTQVLAAYERGRQWALANPAALARILAEAAKLPEPVAAKQLERTQFVSPQPGDAERQTILAAGQALQGAGIIKAEVDVAATVDALLQPSFASSVASAQ